MSFVSLSFPWLDLLCVRKDMKRIEHMQDDVGLKGDSTARNTKAHFAM